MVDLSYLPHFHDHLDRVIVAEGFTPGRYSVQLGSGSALSDGFMSSILKVTITEGDRDLVLLCKIPLPNETRRAQGISLFERESRAYNDLLPMFFEFQRSKGITAESGGFFNAPKCYDAFCVPEKLEALLIMEDLRLKSFRMWNKFQPVDLNHTRLVLTYLGKLHATSFALRDQRPEEFRKLTSYKDPLLTALEESDVFVNMLKAMCDRALSTLEPHEEFRREKVLQLQANMKEEVKMCVSGEFAEPYAVVGHGDCWINNFLFTYESDDKTPKDVAFVDWQICRYGSPAIDLVYFMFLCTDDHFRALHYTELVDVYYQSLSDHLLKLGGAHVRQFPRTELTRQLKQFGKFGFIMAMLILPVICTPSEELPDMDKTFEAYQKQDKNSFHIGTSELAEERYRQRISGVIRDLVQLGYL